MWYCPNTRSKHASTLPKFSQNISKQLIVFYQQAKNTISWRSLLFILAGRGPTIPIDQQSRTYILKTSLQVGRFKTKTCTFLSLAQETQIKTTHSNLQWPNHVITFRQPTQSAGNGIASRFRYHCCLHVNYLCLFLLILDVFKCFSGKTWSMQSSCRKCVCFQGCWCPSCYILVRRP